MEHCTYHYEATNYETLVIALMLGMLKDAGCSESRVAWLLRPNKVRGVFNYVRKFRK